MAGGEPRRDNQQAQLARLGNPSKVHARLRVLRNRQKELQPLPSQGTLGR
jgi:hypothetical protein